ncbi:MAG TPA: hypothetical protein EYO01_08940 [Phycisphaerales bacterium]|nr:hypothetical protein [Phycisphaerales bacterium]HIB01315.1 hypothetical protein [Phycisphaerales bacterium]HIB49817.1 hypothetical protein [Phycisphaerales bacterium]HIO19998.1 hypothetical protein [Phycisphaerales bacterium]
MAVREIRRWLVVCIACVPCVACASFAFALGTSPSLPFTSVTGNGSTYILSQVDGGNSAACEQVNSVSLSLKQLLAGITYSTSCITADGIATANIDAYIQMTTTGIEAWATGTGEANADGGASAFSKHDYYGRIEFDSTIVRRVKIDMAMQASGLSTVYVKLQRIGNVGGGGAPSPSTIAEELNSYINPMTLDGAWVLTLPIGRWKLYAYTAQQCQSTTAGFEFGDTNLEFSVNVVSDGDVDGNGVVNTADILAVIGAWGSCSGCAEDLDGDGLVGVSDVLTVIGSW